MDLDCDLLATHQDGAVDLRDRGSTERERVEYLENVLELLSLYAELAFNDLPHQAYIHRV